MGGGILLVMLVLGYSAIRNLLDWNGYTKGHQAYLAADCAQAIKYFDSVIHGWRLADMGKFAARAQTQRAECVPFQQAVDKQQAGEMSGALLAYLNFMDQFKGSILANTAHNRITSLLASGDPSALASQETCGRIDSLLGEPLFSQPEANLPPFYFACGRAYDTAKDGRKSLAMYEALLLQYPNHLLASEAEKSVLANPLACDRSDSFRDSVIAQRTDFMPSLYYNCGQSYDGAHSPEKSFIMYRALLTEYPDHMLAAQAVGVFITNPIACTESESIKNSIIARRNDLIPSLYYHCGQTYEQHKDWEKAKTMYEGFLAGYPGHILAVDVEAGLARSIVALAQDSSAGSIPEPEVSGSTGSAQTEVIIQNYSPERIRIVFSGPDSRVEELEACPTCGKYSLFGPAYCPEGGPVGHYTLTPGQYEVVVESLSATETTPWTGNWSLVSGDQYSSCFVIVTRVFSQ
jgi:tetratricopeptide (TPR) repeat protein